MKTGIWGAGNIAHTHAEALKASGIKIGAIVDVSEEKAKAFAEEFSIEKWGTDSSILLDDEITTVHVCTPPNLHYDMVMKLLDHKKNVLCEKPLCFDDSQAEELARRAKECVPLILMSDSIWRVRRRENWWNRKNLAASI